MVQMPCDSICPCIILRSILDPGGGIKTTQLQDRASIAGSEYDDTYGWCALSDLYSFSLSTAHSLAPWHSGTLVV
jgi:hypothetical protein